MQYGISCYINISMFHSLSSVLGKCVDLSFEIFLPPLEYAM